MQGFNDVEIEISEHSKQALQSETWKKAREYMKEKARHFTNELLKDDPYGYPWERVVEEYLKSGYMAEGNKYELTVSGTTYKVLKREEVTVFYDQDGNTLFDVENERLEKEYEWEMKGGIGDAAENINTKEDEQGSTSDVTGKNAESEQEPHESVESKGTCEQDGRPTKQQVEEKLKKELAAAKNKSFADPIIGYLMERCREDEGLAEDVMQEHKTWQKCSAYIYSQARKQAQGNYVAVRDDVVYEWAEDYYHKDDKAEEEKKAKEVAARKKSKEKNVDRKEAVKAEKVKGKKKVEEKSAEQPKPRKKQKEMEGQMDLFTMMGMQEGKA